MTDYIGIVDKLAYPIVFLVLGLSFLFTFRNPLTALIRRVRSVTKEGIKTDALPESQNEGQRKQAVEQLMNLGQSVVRDEQEKLILTGLKNQGLDTDSDTIRVLVRHLAATQLALDFQQIYLSIFGSQIGLLKKLNQVPGTGLSEEEIQDYFEISKVLANGVLDEWDLKQYLLYLYNNLLITVQSRKLHITNKGQEFLMWLTRGGFSEDKGL